MFNVRDFLLTFMSIIFEAMPFIVLGAIVSGMLEELLPQQFFNRWLPKNRVLAILGSSLLGFVLPMCECGIVPVMRRLLAKGVPVSCAVTYMLSAPVINPIVLSSTALAFWGTADLFGVGGLGMVLLRGGGAFLTAVTVGLVMERFSRRGVGLVHDHVTRVRLVESDESARLAILDAPGVSNEPEVCAAGACDHEGEHHHHLHDHHEHEHHGHAHGEPHHAPAGRPLLDRLSAIAEIALGDFLDIAAFLVLGAALAAAVGTALPRDQLDGMARYQAASVGGMMLLAFVLSLCSEADAFVAANFVSFSMGAKLAFLVLGPMLDIKLFIMYRWVFQPRGVWTIVAVVIAMVFVIGMGVNALAPLWSQSPGLPMPTAR